MQRMGDSSARAFSNRFCSATFLACNVDKCSVASLISFTTLDSSATRNSEACVNTTRAESIGETRTDLGRKRVERTLAVRDGEFRFGNLGLGREVHNRFVGPHRREVGSVRGIRVCVVSQTPRRITGA